MNHGRRFMNLGRKQQEEHIRRILELYGDLLYRMSLSVVGNSSDAEDMVQDTLVTYLTEAPEFPDEAHEKQWLVKVVRNNSLMLVRKQKNRGSLTRPMPWASCTTRAKACRGIAKKRANGSGKPPPKGTPARSLPWA